MTLYYFDSVRFLRPVTISLDFYGRLVPPMPSFLSLPSAVAYQMPLPPTHSQDINHDLLYIHRAQGRKGRVLDDSTEQLVEDTRMGTTASDQIAALDVRKPWDLQVTRQRCRGSRTSGRAGFRKSWV